MMNWQEIDDKQTWNDFIVHQQNSSFLQSWEFGEFNQSLGRKVWRLGVTDPNLGGICLLIKQKTKLGSFLYVPGGPLTSDEQALDSLISKVTQIAKEERANFVRLDPRIVSPKLASKLASLGLQKVKNFTQPQCSQTLDLTQSFEQILSNFSESTRYNIRWVARQGVTVRVSNQASDIEVFEKLLLQTSARQKFRLHAGHGYYKKQFESFAASGLAKLYLAYEPEKDGSDVLAAAVVINFGQTTTYLHSASSAKNPKLRAPYLMQWQIIQDAKNQGSATYDFWGVSSTDKPSDPWSGVTAFKKGFGGERVEYSAPFDLPVSQRYYVDRILEKTRRLLRF